MNIINIIQPITGSWLVDIILWLEKITASIALSVVLFTVILKLITFPFDFASRASMRKNSLKMEEMRPELERLQKQYANDKDLYNQKMMALYKKNGYSMWGSCLPTILTLVIFIVAINAFTDFSRFKNKNTFYEMSLSYNEVIYEGIGQAEGYITKNSNGTYTIDYDAIYSTYKLNGEKACQDKGLYIEPYSEANTYSFYTENGFIKGNGTYDNNGVSTGPYAVPFELKQGFENNQNFMALSYKNQRDAKATTYSDFIYKENDVELADSDVKKGLAFIQNVQQYKSAEKFREKQARFLWVKNIWVTDSPMKQPINSNYKEFNTENSASISQKDYKNLTAKLVPESTNEPNGYFIMVLLTAGISLLSQLVMNKSQKAQMELQTVDGQGAQTQKMMMWIMPIMMAVFAFMYTTAFSIYIVLSSALGMLNTFIINFYVGRKFNKGKEEKKVVRGRVYIPEEKPKEEKKPKKNKKEEIPENDFLSGLADKKKGRKK